jgi:hypothetical protein
MSSAVHVQELEQAEALHPGLLWTQMQDAYETCEEVLCHDRSTNAKDKA